MITATTENLKHVFNDAERLELGQTLAKTAEEESVFKEEKKQMTAQFSEREADIIARRNRVARLLNAGFEFQMVRCRILAHFPTQGTKTVFREDDGSFVKSETMHSNEMQDTLPFDIDTAIDAEMAKDLRKIQELGLDGTLKNLTAKGVSLDRLTFFERAGWVERSIVEWSGSVHEANLYRDVFFADTLKAAADLDAWDKKQKDKAEGAGA